MVGSTKYTPQALCHTFTQLVSSCNTDLGPGICSPYTVTLGDEFQGVAKSLESAVESIFYFEEAMLRRVLDYKLRYVLHYGIIDTPLNRRIAHGMMGAGLTRARQLLNQKRRARHRFLFELSDKHLTNQLNRLFSVVASLTAQWRPKDYPLIVDMLANDSNEQVGAKHGKNRSQIWKRRRHLRIDEYNTLKQVIFDLIRV